MQISSADNIYRSGRPGDGGRLRRGFRRRPVRQLGLSSPQDKRKSARAAHGRGRSAAPVLWSSGPLIRLQTVAPSRPQTTSWFWLMITSLWMGGPSACCLKNRRALDGAFHAEPSASKFPSFLIEYSKISQPGSASPSPAKTQTRQLEYWKWNP